MTTTRAAAEPRSPSAALSGRSLYVYGIVDRPSHPALIAAAAGGAGLDVTGAGRVAAVHADIDPDALRVIEPEVREGTRLAELARNHDDVVSALARAGAVLPMRLGTVVADRDLLAGLLADAHACIADALDGVRGCSEWQLRIDPTSCADEDRRVPAQGRPGSGAAYLRARRDERRRVSAADHRLGDALDALDEALSFFSTAVRGALTVHHPASRAYLVPNSVQESFVAAADDGLTRLGQLRCTARLLGPRPAYSFADVRLGSVDSD
jgi:hypothetical protein